jgi:hypothetical protein
MALATFQKSVCRLLARNCIASGESCLARGSELNELIDASRISRDIEKCVLSSRGALFRGAVGELEAALERRETRFHAGSIRGGLPQVRDNGR